MVNAPWRARRRPAAGREIGRAGVVARTLTVMAVGAAALIIALLGPRSSGESLHAVLETATAFFALCAAWMAWGQFRESRRLEDLLRVVAILALGSMALVVVVAREVMNLHPTSLTAAAEIAGQVAVAGLFAASAWVGSEPLVIGLRRPGISAIMVGAIGAVVVAAAAFRLVDPGVTPLRHADHPLAVFGLVCAGGLYAATAAMILRRSPRAGQATLLFAGAAVILAAVTIDALFLGLSSLEADTATDAVWVTACVALLGGAMHRQHLAQVAKIRAAVLAERRRAAHDLHDGLAQDLAVIVAQSASIANDLGEDHPVVRAARRALHLSRSAIVELADPGGASPEETMRALAHELMERFGVAIVVDVQVTGPLPDGHQEQLTRVAREAIANAVRHGRATTIVVSLRDEGSGLVLRVLDDGPGAFGRGAVAAAPGFGLRSMQERASLLGGQLNVDCGRTGGTQIELVVP